MATESKKASIMYHIDHNYSLLLQSNIPNSKQVPGIVKRYLPSTLVASRHIHLP
jgi:hypothetical protein